jgi:predicted phosphohydrolase
MAAIVYALFLICAQVYSLKNYLEFFSIGDWGARNSDQKSVAKQMAAKASSNNPSVDFIVSTGDNFYQVGVNSVQDPQWNSTFSDVYLSSESLKDINWFPVLGNHDYYQNPEPQIQYSAINPIWNMDSHYFSKNFSFGDSEVYTAKFVFLDTIIFAPDVSSRTKQFIPNPRKDFENQMNWFKNELKSRNDYDWFIVVGHYPLFNCWMNRQQEDMKDAIQKLLEENHVDLYMAGHDHTLQHFTGNGIEYIISGGGSQRSRPIGILQFGCHFAQGDPGFTYHKIVGKTMNVEFISNEGKVVHSYSQTSKRASANEQ